MRILQIHNTYLQPGGEDTAAAAERQLLEEGGHEVVTWTVQNPENKGAVARGLLRSAWNRSAAQEATRQAKASGATVAHVHNFWYQLSPSIFKALGEAGLPTVFTIHNFRLACANGFLLRDSGPCTDCVGKLAWRGIVRRCYNDSVIASGAVAIMQAFNRRRQTWLHDVDLVVALNAFAADILERSAVPRQKIAIKDNFVHDRGPRTVPPSQSSTVLFVGRIAQDKGPDVLLDAWQGSDTGPLKLQVIGDGPYRAQLERRGVEGVEFLGRLPATDVAKAMRSARALLFPSQAFEGQPMVLLETFAAGLPVVCSDFPPLRALLPHAPEWLLPPQNLDSWTTTIGRLKDDALVDAAGAKNRQEYESRFHPAVALDNLIKLYKRAEATKITGEATPPSRTP